MKKIVLLLLLAASGACIGQVNLNLGLKAYFPFSGNANDYSGNGYNGNPLGGIQLTTDRFGNPNSTYLFDGIDDRIIVSDNGGLSTSAFSICYYFMTEASGVYQNCIGKINYADGNAATYNSGIMNSGEAYFGTIASPGNCFTQVPSTLVYTIFSPSSIQLNQWYCVVNTFENGVEKMYLNGVLVKQGTVPFTNATQCNNTNFIIGSWWQNDPVRFKGKIDDVRFYNRAINADEVNALCVASNTSSCTNWLRTQAVGQSVTVGDLDVSGNQMTIEANFNCSSFPINRPDKWEDIVSKHSNTTDANYVLRMDLAAITTTTGHYLLSPSCDNLVLNKTFHVALVYDGATLKFYRNGFLMGQMPAPGNLILNNWLTTIGDYAVNNPVGTNFLGYINEVRIWNVARTQSQLQTYMNASLPNPATTPGLLGYYTFENLLNKQGNAAYNGTLNGGATINNTNPNCVFVADSCRLTSSAIVNTYTPVLGFNPCDNKLTVEDGSTFNTGDTVLLIQMKGAVIDSTNTAAFGSITNYNNAGNYEFNYVKSKAGNVIELKNKLTRQYDIPLGRVQLIRVPYYSSVNITDTLTCLPWDGNKGGVLAILVRDTITLNAPMDVSGKGFKGGTGYNPGNASLTCFQNNYFYPINTINAAQKGESISSVSSNIRAGKGTLASGGGGGAGHNSGGGGGGNAGSGGFGGYQLEPCGSAPFDNRGIGGRPLNYSTAINKIFMGGGGGAGHADNPGNIPPAGGNGAGIIIVQADKIRSNGQKITANGGNAITCSMPSSPDCHDGMGGGGAAGTVLLSINQFIDNSVIETKGGRGADVIGGPIAAAGRIGPGGGGAGGLAFLKTATLPATLTISNTGGANGVLTQDANNPWGATPGTAGANLFNLVLPVDNIPFKTNIDSVRINETNLTCTMFDFNGLAFINGIPIVSWDWFFGDGGTANTQNTSHTYSTAGTFNVKLVVTDANGCKDSITKPVTSGAFVFKAPPNKTKCGNNSVQLDGNNGANVTYLWSPATYLSDPTIMNPIADPPVTTVYSVTMTSNACGNDSTFNVVVTVSSVLNVDAGKANDIDCSMRSAQLFASGGVNYTWTPATGLSNPNIPNPVATIRTTQKYYVFADNGAGCSGMDSVTVNVNTVASLARYMPNAFTPNGDGLNDCYGLKNWMYIRKLEFRIFNRYGEQVFGTSDPSRCWDGRYKGKIADQGTYVYYIKAETSCGTEEQKGNFLLLR